jgi:hypothetical protein
MAKRLLIILAGIVALLFLLSGCSILRELTVNDVKETKEMAERIVAALDTKDEEALKQLMSPNALANSADLKKGFEYIQDLYRGTAVTFGTTGNETREHYGSPGRLKTVYADYDIETDQDRKYTLFFELILIDDSNPQNEGLYYIKLFDSQSCARSEVYRYSATYNRPGIYHPGWEVQPDSAV